MIYREGRPRLPGRAAGTFPGAPAPRFYASVMGAGPCISRRIPDERRRAAARKGEVSPLNPAAAKAALVTTEEVKIPAIRLVSFDQT